MGIAGKSIIVLCRSNLWTNRYRKFKVLIDGRKEGTIASGQSESYTVTPGRHNIQVRLDWYKSEPLELDLVEGEEVRLECGPRTGISAELNAIVSPGGALYVKAADETVSGSQEGVWSKIVTLADQKLAEYSDAHTSEHQLETRRTGIHLFISYRREDSPDVCGRIYDRLIQQFGKEAVFKDIDSIPFGVDFRTYLEEVVSKCAIMLAIIGDGWLDTSGPEGKSRLFDPRDYVRIEIESALKRNIPVVPLFVRGAELPEESELPDPIKPLVFRNGLQIRPDPDFHHDMDRLIERVCEGTKRA